MLCGEASRSIIEQLQRSVSSHLELYMSILLTVPRSISPVPATNPATPLHQFSSGIKPAVRRQGWWSWLDRRHQRMALREIADDPHLLRDLGLSREEALREAAKPFWR